MIVQSQCKHKRHANLVIACVAAEVLLESSCIVAEEATACSNAPTQAGTRSVMANRICLAVQDLMLCKLLREFSARVVMVENRGHVPHWRLWLTIPYALTLRLEDCGMMSAIELCHNLSSGGPHDVAWIRWYR
jgi:hypothetical protein